MLCTQAYSVLNFFNESLNEDLENVDLSLFVDRQYLVKMNPNVYEQLIDSLKPLEKFEKKLEKQTQLKEELEEKISELKEKLDSFWHRLFYFSSIDREKSELSDKKYELSKIQDDYRSLSKSVRDLRTQKELVEELIPCSGSYYQLSDSGEKFLSKLSAAIDRLKETELDQYEQELKDLESGINKRYKRFLEMKEKVNDKFGSYDSGIQFALSLSCQEGDLEEIYERACVIHRLFEEKDWGSSKAYPIISSLVAEEGFSRSLVDRLSEMFQIMLDDDHADNYATLTEASILIKNKGNLRSIYDRFERIRDELAERQWSRGGNASCFIAAHLVKHSGSESEVAERFRNMEKAIVATGREDGIETGLAARVLLDISDKDLKDIVQDFEENFIMLYEHGWTKSADYYVAAAVMGVMPGTPKEDVLILDEITERLKKDGFRDVTYKAIPIVAGAYRDFFKDMPVTSSSSYSSSSDYSSSSSIGGFSVGGAIMGDIIDNGKIDFSGGALVGGLLGGDLF